MFWLSAILGDWNEEELIRKAGTQEGNGLIFSCFPAFFMNSSFRIGKSPSCVFPSFGGEPMFSFVSFVCFVVILSIVAAPYFSLVRTIKRVSDSIVEANSLGRTPPTRAQQILSVFPSNA